MLTADEQDRFRELVLEAVRDNFPGWDPDNPILTRSLKGLLDAINRATNENTIRIVREALTLNNRAILNSVRDPLTQAVLNRVHRMQTECNDALRAIGILPPEAGVGPQPEPEEFRVPDMKTLWERLDED